MSKNIGWSLLIAVTWLIWECLDFGVYCPDDVVGRLALRSDPRCFVVCLIDVLGDELFSYFLWSRGDGGVSGRLHGLFAVWIVVPSIGVLLWGYSSSLWFGIFCVLIILVSRFSIRDKGWCIERFQVNNHSPENDLCGFLSFISVLGGESKGDLDDQWSCLRPKIGWRAWYV